MALTATTLNGAITAAQKTVALTSGTGAAVGSIIRIDNEKVLIQDITNTPVIGVSRGVNGTAAVAHTTLAPAVIGLPADFPPGPVENDLSYGADGAISIVPGQVWLTKATALAATLADPTQAQNGLTMVFTSRTAAAHVITGVNIWDGTATVNTTLTFAAVAGASITLQAQNGAWNVISLNAVTPAP